MDAFAAVAPGLEEALLDELSELGVEGRVEPGGVAFRADTQGLAGVHLHSRIAGRVTIGLGTIGAASLDALSQGVRGLPWKQFAWPTQPVVVQLTSRRSRLRNRDAVARKVENSIHDALRGPRLPGPKPPREPLGVSVRVENDKALVTVDASGELLHKRGWRKATAKAPLRENLAAAVLRVAQWAPGEALVDPMCGAGTFPIEAAGIALGHAPGGRRAFAFERFPGFDKKAWERQKLDSKAEAIDRVAPIVAADRDEGAIEATRSNADRAGVGGRIHVVRSMFHELEPPVGPGLVVMNPPYGERIEGSGGPARVYKLIGETLRKNWRGWRVAILVPGSRWLGALGFPVDKGPEFSNGGIKVILALGTVP